MPVRLGKRWLTAVAGCLIGLLLPTLLAGCGPATSQQQAEAPKSVLRIGWYEGPQSGLNPFLARSNGDYVFLALLYEPLVLPLIDGTVKPWLAKTWEYRPEEKAWVFHLDERAKWSDGTPLTAEDVKFTFDMAYEHDFPMSSVSKGFVDKVEAPDAHTVVFRLKEPSAAFLSLVSAVLIAPKHIWSQVEKIDVAQNFNPVGSGPFMVKEYQPRAYLHLVKNPNYWQGPARVDEVVLQIFANPDAQVVALKKGELDLIPDLSGNEALLAPLMTDPNIRVEVERASHIWYIAVNYRIYPLNLKPVRQAIDLAVDRKELIEKALGGYADMPLMGYVAPVVSKWANPNVTWKGLNLTAEQRIERANALLDGLGFARGPDGIRRTKDGKRLQFTIRCITYPSYIRAAEMIKEDLAKIGIGLEVLVSDPETLFAGIVYSGKRPNDWELMLHGSNMQPDPDHFARSWAPEPPTPWDQAPAFGWEHKELQTLLKQSRREMDEKKRWELVQKAQEMFAEELVVITLGHRYQPAAYRVDKFDGWNPEPVRYGQMFFPLASAANILSLQPKS